MSNGYFYLSILHKVFIRPILLALILKTQSILHLSSQSWCQLHYHIDSKYLTTNLGMYATVSTNFLKHLYHVGNFTSCTSNDSKCLFRIFNNESMFLRTIKRLTTFQQTVWIDGWQGCFSKCLLPVRTYSSLTQTMSNSNVWAIQVNNGIKIYTV